MSSILTDKGTAPGVAFGTDPKAFQPSQRERELRDWVLLDILGSPAYKDFATWIKDKLLIDGFELPISNVLGFTQFVANAATPIITSEGTASTTYTNLATVGPELTGLSDGQYVFIFGNSSVNSGAATAHESLSINAAVPIDNDSADNSTQVFSGTARAVVKTLSGGGNNSVRCQYRSSAGASTATFYNRWLVGLRVANP